MKVYLTVAVSMAVGMAVGGLAVQGLHAQGGKLKAYSVGEVERIGTDPAYIDSVRKAIVAAHGQALRTVGGRVVKIEGAEPPNGVAIVEWDSLDDAVAFYKSKAWMDLAPQRDKVQKAIRRYVVEVEK
jgi:uncharacterized protein (DUF1330 family)